MEHRIIDISLLDPNEGQIDGLPSNPRKWSEDDLSRLEDSIRETPELLEARGIIVVPRDGRYLVLGGNMRLAAIRGLGRTEAPCIVLPETTPAEKLREIVIKDNGAFGAWDMDALANEWDRLSLPGDVPSPEELLQAFFRAFEWRYEQPQNDLHADFMARLWRGDGAPYPYRESASGELFEARIAGVDPHSGELTLRLADGTERCYWFKEVEPLF